MNEYIIVHIENNELYLNIIERLLKPIKIINYEPLYVQSKEDAWIKIENLSIIPDLIISDLMLNDDYNPQPGVDLIMEIQNHPKFNNTKIVALTATLQENPKKQLVSKGVYYYSKTFRPSTWGQEIINILEKDVKPDG